MASCILVKKFVSVAIGALSKDDIPIIGKFTLY